MTQINVYYSSWFIEIYVPALQIKFLAVECDLSEVQSGKMMQNTGFMKNKTDQDIFGENQESSSV